MNYSKFSGLIACKMAMLLAFMFAACSEDSAVSPLAQDGGYTEEQASLENIKVVAQARLFETKIDENDTTKVNFVSSVPVGSVVRMSELDSINFSATGLVYYSQSKDTSGVFSFDSVSLKSPYVMLELSPYECGEWYDLTGQERKWVDGCVVNGTTHYMVYSLIVDLRKVKNVGINVATTIETKRLLGLIGQGMSFEDAKRQSESEILSAFGIYGVPYRFNKAESQENQDEILFASYVVGFTPKTEAGLANAFAKVGSFKAIPNVKNDFVEGIVSWFDAEWIGDDVKVRLHDLMHNFMASLWELDPCSAGNEGYSTAFTYDVHRDIDFVCKNGAWSYLVHYVVPDSVGAVIGEMTDSRDGSKYKTVTYNVDGGTQTWLAENLKYKSADGIYFWNDAMALPDSVALIPYEDCIEEDSYTNCDRLQAEKSNLDYERLWAITDSVKATGKNYQGICPDGWHLPDANEWKKLRNYVEGKVNARMLDYRMDMMAIAGFGESDKKIGAKYAVKIDSTFKVLNNTDLVNSTVISIYSNGTKWTYISRKAKFNATQSEYLGENEVSVRCVKD